MRIRKPRGVTTGQLMVITAVGFIGGIYIWQPLMLKYKKEQLNTTSSESVDSAATKAVIVETTRKS